MEWPNYSKFGHRLKVSVLRLFEESQGLTSC